MNVALIILSNVIFSVGGFIIGFVMARMGQRVERIERQVEEVSEVIVDGDKSPVSPSRKFRFRWTQLLGVVVLVLAIGSTFTSAMATLDQRRIASCQADFNKAYRLAIVERAEAANKERSSMRTMLAIILNPASNEDVRRKAVTAYYQSLDQGDQTRADHPLPETDRCE